MMSGTGIADNVGKVAVLRGPIVYAFEGADNGGHVLGSSISSDGMAVEYRADLLGGVTVLKARGQDAAGAPRALLGVPYFAWANRGAGEMAVWLTKAARADR
jgi:DUF1680 family protein